MSSQYFKDFPTFIDVTTGFNLKNLMFSSRMTGSVLNRTQLFYPYTVKEGETATSVAYNYYGSIDYVWLVFFANNIIDYYSQWPKSQYDLDQYVISEYGSVPAAQGLIDHYYKPDDPSYPAVSVESFNAKDTINQGLFMPRYTYDYLMMQNEAKRKIQLVNKNDAPRISLELEQLLTQ